MSDNINQVPETAHEDPTTYELDRLLRKLYEDACRREIPGELRALPFNGGQGQYEILDDVGAPGLSYGIINPTESRAYFNVAGGKARAGHGIPVPAKAALVMPIAVSGHVMVGVEEADLLLESATLYRLRFHTVQPFFLGAI